MKIPSFRRLSREDFKGAPSWVDNLIYPINSFMDSVYSGLSQLTIGENIVGSFKSFNFKTKSTYSTNQWDTISFPNPLNKKVDSVTICQIQKLTDNYQPITKATSVDWIQLNSNIQINFITGLEDSTNYSVKLLIL